MNKSLFVDILRQQIKKQGFKQEDFAESIGIGYSTLKKYLSVDNDVMPSAHILVSMCEHLNCDADYLLGRISFTTHKAKEFFDITGLSETTFNYLKELNEQHNPDDDIKISTLNHVIVSKEFNNILQYIGYTRVATTGFPIKYNNAYSAELSDEKKASLLSAIATNEDYIDSREYHASKEFGALFDNIIHIPLEDVLMIYDYMDYYYEKFGEHFPSKDFETTQDAACQIKECLLTCTPLKHRKDGE